MKTIVKTDPDQVENISRNKLLVTTGNTTTSDTATNKVSKPPLSAKNSNTLNSGPHNNKSVLKGFILNTNVPLRKDVPTVSSKSPLKVEPETSPILAQLSLPTTEVENGLRDRAKRREVVTSELPPKVPKDPGKFTACNLLLLETNDSETNPHYKISQETLEEIFFGSDESTEEDLIFCKAQGVAPFKEWVGFAEDLNKKQLSLIKELVKLKTELSFKFSVILELINSHAESLVKRGDILDDKFAQIQRIGEDLLRLL